MRGRVLTHARNCGFMGRKGALLVLAVMTSSLALARSEAAFQMLHEFFPSEGVGSFPECRLVQGNDGAFYGTMRVGGSYSCGTIFKYGPGSGLTNLLSFNGTNGCCPRGGLTFGSDGNFYGVTFYGGSN